MTPLGLRGRIALLAVALVLGVGATIGVSAYLTMRRSLHGQALRQAARQADRLASLVDVAGQGGGQGDVNRVDLSDRALSRDFPLAGTLVRIEGPTGRAVQVSPAASGLALGAGARAACAARGAANGALRRPRVAFACRRIGPAAGAAGTVVAAVSLRSADAALATLRRALWLGLAAGALMAVALSFALAHRALRPARRIAAAARSIREGDLSQRIGYVGPKDELGTLAAELDACFAKLHEAILRQRDFVADASHELKTPVAAMRAHVELLRRWAATDPVSRELALGGLDRAARRAGHLVADLLVLAELDREAEPPAATVWLDGVVLEVVRDSAPLRREVAIRITRLDEVAVRGDALRLHQLVANLVDNALRVSSPGREVRVGLADLGGEASVIVADDGPGIPEDQLGRIFERFVRADRRSRLPPDGTGLGLAIAQAIACAHGGRLGARNGAAGGAEFELTLPAAEASPNLHRPLSELSSGGRTVAGPCTPWKEDLHDDGQEVPAADHPRGGSRGAGAGPAGGERRPVPDAGAGQERGGDQAPPRLGDEAHGRAAPDQPRSSGRA